VKLVAQGGFIIKPLPITISAVRIISIDMGY